MIFGEPQAQIPIIQIKKKWEDKNNNDVISALLQQSDSSLKKRNSTEKELNFILDHIPRRFVFTDIKFIESHTRSISKSANWIVKAGIS